MNFGWLIINYHKNVVVNKLQLDWEMEWYEKDAGFFVLKIISLNLSENTEMM